MAFAALLAAALLAVEAQAWFVCRLHKQRDNTNCAANGGTTIRILVLGVDGAFS